MATPLEHTRAARKARQSYWLEYLRKTQTQHSTPVAEQWQTA
jgi:hypothetical protein